jgi:hypothetical protein
MLFNYRTQVSRKDIDPEYLGHHDDRPRQRR